jgi:hypothetical protein
MVKQAENWFDQSDYNGDGIWDWWRNEDIVRTALPVPELPPYGCLVPGCLYSLAYRDSGVGGAAREVLSISCLSHDEARRWRLRVHRDVLRLSI